MAQRDAVSKTRLYAAGLWLLAPAPAVFALRALLLYARDTFPGWLGAVMALGGALSLVGLILAGTGSYGSDRFRTVAAGVVLVLLGHYVLGDRLPNVGDALVYAGTGLVAFPVRPGAVVPAGLAAVGVLVRDQADWGHLLVAAGAAALAVLLVLAGRDVLGRTGVAAQGGTRSAR